MTRHKELTAFLIDDGWKKYPTIPPLYPELTKELWAKKNPGTPSFCLNFVSMTIHYIVSDFISVDITGEVGGTWYKLEAYSMSVDHFISNHETIEQELTNSWRAIG